MSRIEQKTHIAMVCKLMPYYRLGIFQELSAVHNDYEFSFLGDTKEQAGIRQIPYSYASATGNEKIRWIRTVNYFYKPERLLWQTEIIKEIFKSTFKVFVFEGAIAHYPIWLFAFLAKLRGKKVIFWTHGNRGLDTGIKKFLRKVLFKWMGDGLFLYGHVQKNHMINDGYDPDRLFVIYNSLQPTKQFALLEKINTNLLADNAQSKPFTLLFIGRLTSGKQVMEILKMMREFKNESCHINCIFIGEGSEKMSMMKYCKENDLEDQVRFLGALYEEEAIAPYFAEADLMISPGNVGLNCIHSLAYGVPVLTHDDFNNQNPEVEAITPGKNGILYKHNDFEDMKDQLKIWMDQDHDPEGLKLACQEVINERYNPNHQKKSMIEGINQLLNGK